MNDEIEDILTRDDFLQELKNRTGYPKNALDDVLKAVADILSDGVRCKKEVRVRGLFTLKHILVSGYNGVNAYKTRISGKIVHEQYPDFWKTSLLMAENIRDAGKFEEVEIEENK